MPQVAIRGIYQDGKITPLEDVPFQEARDVIIVFNDAYSDESRYATPEWKIAEQQASEDYKTGRVESAGSINEMFQVLSL